MAVRGKRSGRDLGLALAALLGALVVLDRGAMVAECRNRHRKAAEGVGLERGDTHKAGDLIGWRGEVHKVETAKPDPGQPFVMSEYWDKDVNQPLGADQWVAWYHGFTGDAMDDERKANLVRRRDEHQSAQLTQPCMTLGKFVEAGLAAKAFDLDRENRLEVESVRVFPEHGADDRAGLPLYAHMATLALAPNGSIALAFQASPSIEGGDGQRIWIAYAKTPASAMEWWPANPVPIEQGGGTFKAPEFKFVTAAQWGPVLQSDEARAKLHLFFSESGGDCHEPANAEEGHGGRWVVGGDIKMTSMDANARDWEKPRAIHKQSEGKIPKITANGALITSQGTWILPFWRQKPRHIFIHNPETDQTTRRCNGPKNAKRRTSAAVLVSHDGGATWKAHGRLETRAAGWLIENTLVELSDASLLMLFRTKAGAVFACKSEDQGLTWTQAHVIEGLVNTDSKLHLTRMRDFRLLLAHNDHPRPFAHDKASNDLVASRERTRMVVSVSSDDGMTWQRLLRIDPTPSENESKDFQAYRESADPFQLREMDSDSDLSVQNHYPYLLELAGGGEGAIDASCKAVVAYTKSKLNVVTQKTSGHEIWVSCVPGL